MFFQASKFAESRGIWTRGRKLLRDPKNVDAWQTRDHYSCIVYNSMKTHEKSRSSCSATRHIGTRILWWFSLQNKKKIVGKSNFSEQFWKLINRYKRIRYNSYVMRQTECPTSVDSYASLFNCTTAGRTQTQWWPRHKAFTSGLVHDAMSLAWPTVVQLVVSFNSGLHWGINQEYSFFVSSQWLIWFCVFTEMHWLSQEAIMWTELFMYFCIKNYIGIQGEVCTVKGL